MNKLQPELLSRLSLACLVFAGLSSTGVAIAEDTTQNWYTVEVVTFTRARDSQLQETWLDGGTSLSPDQTSKQLQRDNLSSENPMPVMPVPEAEMKLSRHAYSLGRSPELTIRSHQAWRQPGLPREQAGWINLDSESSQLTGQVRISLSRYLHAELDLKLKNPQWSPAFHSTSGETHQQNAEFIPIRAARRLKRDEIQYIDHPLAGALIRIERYEMPSREQNAAPEALSTEKPEDSNSPNLPLSNSKTGT